MNAPYEIVRIKSVQDNYYFMKVQQEMIKYGNDLLTSFGVLSIARQKSVYSMDHIQLHYIYTFLKLLPKRDDKKQRWKLFPVRRLFNLLLNAE